MMNRLAHRFGNVIIVRLESRTSWIITLSASNRLLSERCTRLSIGSSRPNARSILIADCKSLRHEKSHRLR